MNSNQVNDRLASLTAEQITELLGNYLPAQDDGKLSPWDGRADRRKSAVFVPLLKVNGHWELLFIKRTDKVHDHKNQVAFPGGSAEPEDADEEATACRELQEEIGIAFGDVRIFGKLKQPVEVTHYSIYPVIGTFPWPYSLSLSNDEVSRVFCIPLAWLADRDHWEIRPFERDGQTRQVIFYQPYAGEVLWGASAKIVVQLIEALHLD